MENSNKATGISKLVLFLEFAFAISLGIMVANFEKLGKVIVLVPWLFVIWVLLSIGGIVLGIRLKGEKTDERIEDMGPLGPKPQIFYSVSSTLITWSIIHSVVAIITSISLFYFLYFSSF
ncbi:MAG: hypothetical protein KBD54_02905 [Candidatus Pacebacteria bacterium]|jgi:hypothetical protein|nr:hypothetical protein [Candidatus Paceibacterota bacterium]